MTNKLTGEIMAMWENMIEWYICLDKQPQSSQSWLGWDGWVEPALEQCVREADDE